MENKWEILVAKNIEDAHVVLTNLYLNIPKKNLITFENQRNRDQFNSGHK